MALQMSFEGPDGTVYPDGYIYVTSIIASPEISTICTNWYADQAAYEAGELPISQPAYTSATTLFDTGPIFDVAYNYLLTLPEFAEAVVSNDLVN